MPEPLLYLKAMGAAAIVSSLFVLAMAKVRPAAGKTWWNSTSVLGMGLGLAAGYGVMSVRFAWPPRNGLDRFLLIIIPACLVIELVGGFQRVPRAVAWLLRMILAAATPWILLHGSVYLNGSGDEWTQAQAITVLAVCTVLLAVVWSLLAWLSRRSPGISIPIAVSLSTLCTGMTVMMAGYIKGGSAALPLVATLVATSLGTRLINARPINQRSAVTTPTGSPPMLAIGVVSLFGLLFIGHFFGRLSTGSAVVILWAPLLCWATETSRLRHSNPWFVGSLRLLLVAIPLLVVLILAKLDFDREFAPLLETF